MVEVNEAKAALGRRLFHDPRLSKNDTISCATCHDLSAGGDDGQVVSIGIEGRPGLVNAPTVFNSGYNFKQFWDGRADTLTHGFDHRKRSGAGTDRSDGDPLLESTCATMMRP